MSDAPSGTTGFIEDVARWRQAVPHRVPSYHRLLDELLALLRSSTPAGARLEARLQEAWAARTFNTFYERPLLLIAALRNDALRAGESHALWHALAGPTPDEQQVTREALLAAFASEPLWVSLRTRFVQTNETSRAVAWLWPAQLMGCADGRHSLELVEAGTAAGLNLVADRLPAPWSDAAGRRLIDARPLQVVSRIGVDANPLDVRDDGDAGWLRACVWAGEPERSARLEAAIAAFRAAPAALVRGDLSELPARLRGLSERRAHAAVVLALQTIVRDYLPATARAAYEAAMRRWIAGAPPASAVWMELELDRRAGPNGPVPLVAHVREGSAEAVTDLCLGTTGYHPRVVSVDDDAVARFAHLFN